MLHVRRYLPTAAPPSRWTPAPTPMLAMPPRCSTTVRLPRSRHSQRQSWPRTWVKLALPRAHDAPYLVHSGDGYVALVMDGVNDGKVEVAS